MKKILFILSLLIISFASLAQETPPTGLKSVNAQFSINLIDSSIWHNKGTPYGWERLSRYKDLLLLNPTGQRNQMQFVTTTGLNKYFTDDQLKVGQYVMTDAQLTAALTRGLSSQDEIFKTWGRFSHGTTPVNPGVGVQSDTIPGNPLHMNTWNFDTVAHAVVSGYNAGDLLGFYSPDKYDSYTHTVTLSSSIGDNDWIGVVIAFYRDPSHLVFNNAYGLDPTLFNFPVNTTDLLIPDEHTITLLRGRNGSTVSYFIVYDYMKLTQKTIANGSSLSGLWNTTTPWGGASVDVFVQRSGDTITCKTTNYSDAPGGKGSLAFPLTFLLTGDPVLAKFRGPQSYGYAVRSQQGATFTGIDFSGTNNAIYDLRNGNAYVYGSAGYALSTSRNFFTDIGPGRLVFDKYTNKQYYMTPDSVVHLISSGNAPDSSVIAATYMQKDSGVVRLPDIAALMAYTGAADVAVVAEKLRGGTFCRNAIGTDTVNNGITISSAVPGKIWKRQINAGSAINVAWFGAVGDGVTDNTTAINSAILSKASKDIFFPNSQYPYIAQYIKWLDGNVFIGQSRAGVIIKKKDHTAGTVGDDNLFARFDKTSLGDVTISNMTIDGNYQNQDNRVYTISGSAVNFNVYNVSFINTSTGAIFLQNTGKADIARNSFEHMQEHGDVFNETSVAITVAESSISNDKRITHIHDNTFLADTPSTPGKAPGGIIITAGTTPHEHSILIENNIFDGIGQNYLSNLIGGIYEYSSSGLTHLVSKNNKFYHRRAAAIAVLAEYGSLTEGNYVEGIDSVSAATLGGVAAYNLAIKSSPAAAPTKTAYQFTDNMAIDQVNSNALSIAGRSDVNIDNVEVRGFKSTGSNNGILVSYAAGVTLDNVNISGTTSPLTISNSTGTLSLINSTIKGGNTSILARTGVTGLNIAINNSHITGGTSYPITFRNGNTLIMSNSEIAPSGSAGIDARSIVRVVLKDNYGTSLIPDLTSSTNIFQQDNSWTSVTNGGVYYGNTASGFQQTAAGGATQVLHGGTTPSMSALNYATDGTGVLPVGNGGSGQSTYTDGQLLIGKTTGGTLSKATLTPGWAFSITNGPGSITIAPDSATLSTKYEKLSNKVNDTTLNANSTSFYPTEKAVKTYIDKSVVLQAVNHNRSTQDGSIYGFYNPSVPAGKRLVISKVIVVCIAASGITAPANIRVYNGAGTDLIPDTPLTGLTTAGSTYTLTPPANSIIVTAGDQVRFNFTTLSTGTSQTVDVYLIGMLI